MRSLSHYKTTGWVFKFLSRRFFQTLAWGIWALLSSFLIFLQLILYSPEEWIALAVCIPVFWLVFTNIRRSLSGEFKKPYLETDGATRWSRLLTPFLMLTLFGAAVIWFDNVQSFSSLSEAVATKRAGIPADTDSVLVALGLQLLTFSDGLKSYLAGNMQFLGAQAPLVLMIAGSYIVFFNASATLSCFVIPASEYRRVFGPISEDDVPPALSKSRVALVSALITVLVVFIYLPLFAYMETVAKDHPEVKTWLPESSGRSNESTMPITTVERSNSLNWPEPRPWASSPPQRLSLKDKSIVLSIRWAITLTGTWTGITACLPSTCDWQTC